MPEKKYIEGQIWVKDYGDYGLTARHIDEFMDKRDWVITFNINVFSELRAGYVGSSRTGSTSIKTSTLVKWILHHEAELMSAPELCNTVRKRWPWCSIKESDFDLTKYKR